MIVLDTDICIDLLRGNEGVLDRRRREDDNVAVTFITVGELYYGVEKSGNPGENRKLVEIFLLSVNCIYPDHRIMARFGELKAQLSREEQILPDADILIAATCLCIGSKLVTGNLKRFKRIQGLPLDNWRD